MGWQLRCLASLRDAAATFGKNVEDVFGRLGFLVLCVARGLGATVTQARITLVASPVADSRIPF